MSTKDELRTRVQELEAELTEQKRRVEVAYKARDREHSRAAAANKRNSELQKALRRTVHEKKMLQLSIDADKYNIRRLKVAWEQLRMIREVVSLTQDDALTHAADVPLDKLLGKSH